MITRRTLQRLVSMEWSKLLQYRADITLWTITQAMAPLISLFVWYTVALSNEEIPSQEILAYYIIVMLVSIITFSWGGAYLAREILDGSIVRDLIKPISPFWHDIVNNITVKTMRLVIPFPLFVLIAYSYKSYFPQAIYEVRNIAFFTVSLALAVILAFCLDMAFGTFAFWLEDAFSIRRYKEMAHEVFSGILIPIYLMPETMQAALGMLPFPYIISKPVEILIGRIEGEEILLTLAYQCIWISTAIFALIILWKKGLQRYEVPGQ